MVSDSEIQISLFSEAEEPELVEENESAWCGSRWLRTGKPWKGGGNDSLLSSQETNEDRPKALRKKDRNSRRDKAAKRRLGGNTEVQKDFDFTGS